MLQKNTKNIKRKNVTASFIVETREIKIDANLTHHNDKIKTVLTSL